jgi:hypothetical protein
MHYALSSSLLSLVQSWHANLHALLFTRRFILLEWKSLLYLGYCLSGFWRTRRIFTGIFSHAN